MAAVSAMSMTIDAAVNVTLISPKEGDVEAEGNFPEVYLNVGEAIEQVMGLTMKSEAGESVSCPWTYDFGVSGMIVDCSNVTKSGKWTLTVPAGALDLDGETNAEKSFTWNFTNTAAGSETPAALALTASLSGNNGTVNAGGTFEQTSPFPNISIRLPEYGCTIAGSTLNVTSDTGFNENVELNTNFYNGKMDLSILVKMGDKNVVKSGVYTVHVPAGFFTSKKGATNEAVDFSWTYVNSNDQGGGEEEQELVVKTITVGGVDVTSTHELAQMGNGDEVTVSINPIADAKMVTLRFTNAETGAHIRYFEIYNRDGNDEVVADPATGVYKTVSGGSIVNKFTKGTKYNIEVMAYTTNNAQDPSGFSYGPVNVEFQGTTEPYKFSPVQVVSVSPVTGSEITDPSQPITITYSAPVEVTRVAVSEGGQGATINEMISLTTPNADRTEWTVRPGKSFWSASDGTWMFQFYAKDENGLVVEGNHGVESGSYYQVDYACFNALPEVTLSPASGMVEELYTFTIEDSRGIGLGYNAVPYVIDAEGNVVAKVDMNSQVLYDKNGVEIADVEEGTKDVLAVKSVFNLDKAITEPGAYTFIAPHASFSIGTEFSSKFNRYQESAYTVVKLPVAKVNVELVNFAAASFDVVEGKSATVALKPAADWKLASLTLDGKDVTAAVVDNAYTIASVEKDVNLVATYEFAHDVAMIESSGIVDVAGKEVKVYNQAENIVVEGVAAGDTVKIYTVNGMMVGSMTATQDIVTVTCPVNQVYVVVINDSAVKIKH